MDVFNNEINEILTANNYITQDIKRNIFHKQLCIDY